MDCPVLLHGQTDICQPNQDVSHMGKRLHHPSNQPAWGHGHQVMDTNHFVQALAISLS